MSRAMPWRERIAHPNAEVIIVTRNYESDKNLRSIELTFSSENRFKSRFLSDHIEKLLKSK